MNFCKIQILYLSVDVREIYSSLFDHKPAVHREVEYFVKEFEVCTSAHLYNSVNYCFG